MKFSEDLISQYSEPWLIATTGPFLDKCKDGSLETAAFDTWLIQDYFFGRECCRFLALNLARAPYSMFATLLGGLAALDDELKWFQRELAARNIDWESHVQSPTCTNYMEYLLSLTDASLPVQMTVLWAVERAYHEAWSGHCPMEQPYDAYAQRWASTAFAEYIEDLAKGLDEIMEEQEASVRDEAREAFLKVCELEKAFWAMVVNT